MPGRRTWRCAAPDRSVRPRFVCAHAHHPATHRRTFSSLPHPPPPRPPTTHLPLSPPCPHCRPCRTKRQGPLRRPPSPRHPACPFAAAAAAAAVGRRRRCRPLLPSFCRRPRCCPCRNTCHCHFHARTPAAPHGRLPAFPSAAVVATVRRCRRRRRPPPQPVCRLDVAVAAAVPQSGRPTYLMRYASRLPVRSCGRPHCRPSPLSPPSPSSSPPPPVPSCCCCPAAVPWSLPPHMPAACPSAAAAALVSTRTAVRRRRRPRRLAVAVPAAVPRSLPPTCQPPACPQLRPPLLPSGDVVAAGAVLLLRCSLLPLSPCRPTCQPPACPFAAAAALAAVRRRRRCPCRPCRLPARSCRCPCRLAGAVPAAAAAVRNRCRCCCPSCCTQTCCRPLLPVHHCLLSNCFLSLPARSRARPPLGPQFKRDLDEQFAWRVSVAPFYLVALPWVLSARKI